MLSKSLSGHECLTHCCFRRSPDSPTTGIRALIKLSGGRERDPYLDQASDVGDSHYQSLG
ncbi:hypothetical protein MTR_1g019350 [Medicago truncatula]|uniref:Uncharacterized protein n=1 Tax=Medicago truncatula TaxID=3880 RepID=G7I3J5_MEDTR|nr:hypothetical protein MTR_1g019350 [Medicago truncatula]